MTVPLGEGTHTIGRTKTSDVVFPSPSVSRNHCEVDVRGSTVQLTDVGSTGGTYLNGVALTKKAPHPLHPSDLVEVGTVQFAIRPSKVDDRPTAVDPVRYANGAGEIPFNRPPRASAPTVTPPIPAPTAAKTQPKPTFNVLQMATPAVFGLVMVLALHNWLFALTALLSPVMAAVNVADARRKAAKSSRSGGKKLQAELANFETSVKEAARRERERLLLAHPDLSEVVRRATLPSARLWERRPSHPDFLHISIGLGPVAWQPALEERGFEGPAPEASEILAKYSQLANAPVSVDLLNGGPIGIVGDRAGALGVARALLCQAAVHHGPSDLQTLVLIDEDRVTDWDWIKWLPHVRDQRAGDIRNLVYGDEACNTAVRQLLDRGKDQATRAAETIDPAFLVIIDAANLTRRRDSAVRELLRSSRFRATGIVIANSADLLPDACTAITTVHASTGEATFARPQQGVEIPDLLANTTDEVTARRCARALARYEDPEISVPGASLPQRVPVTSMLGLEGFDATEIRRRWDVYRDSVKQLAAADLLAKPPLSAPVGRTEHGLLYLDIVNDGPHGLVGGTTGSGKTEFLRSLVLSLAATAGPDFLNFLFIDFKGAAGFEKLAELPHAVGLATNLDGTQAGRVLQCLEAELNYRQRCFREAPGSVEELHRYWAISPEPLPRLLVVIDELAEFAVALPDFLPTLIRIGRIGRTLGIHLLLATQRPGSVVSSDLKENTNFAVALRVREPANSIDLIGVPHAAAIPPRNASGRAFLRVGGDQSGPPALFQSALSSGQTTHEESLGVTIAPFVFGLAPTEDVGTGQKALKKASSEPSDLEQLTEAMVTAYATTGQPAPREPWTSPLGTTIALEDIPPSPDLGADGAPNQVMFALADDIMGQSKPAAGWDLRAGNLIFYGVVGSGTTTSLASVALGITAAFPSGSAHIYVLDCGSGELTDLEALPEIGGVITANESERQQRLMGLLIAELAARKSSRRNVSERPSLFLLIDSFSGLIAAGESVPNLLDDVGRIFTEGPDAGIFTAVTAGRPSEVPFKLADLAPQKWVHRLADVTDYTAFGLPKVAASEMPPGRAFLAGRGMQAQIALPMPSIAVAVKSRGSSTVRRRKSAPSAPAIATLPTEVSLDELAGLAQLAREPWFIPVGVSSSTLAATGWHLHTGEHALIAGPARSNKSNLLLAITQLVRREVPDVVIVALARDRSPLASAKQVTVLVDSTENLLNEISSRVGQLPLLVIIDDAHLVTDSTGALEAFLHQTPANAHVIAAGRTDDLRGIAFGHWTQPMRKGRTGLLLKIAQQAHGELLGLNLPFRRTFDTQPGRGYLANDGELDLIQAMRSAD
jgi:S-DNA-T family DNA segregation ATPase FtsK/SpoIIIE